MQCEVLDLASDLDGDNVKSQLLSNVAEICDHYILPQNYILDLQYHLQEGFCFNKTCSF